MSTLDNQNLTNISEGKIQTLLKEKDIETLEWHPHASFQGVQMKHLICSEDTDGKFSVHLVCVQAGCALEDHTHAGRWELHEVVAGSGSASLGGKTVTYKPSTFAVIPADTVHRVDAETTLILLAKFVPALM